MILISIIFVSLLFEKGVSQKANNVCPTFRDYFTMSTNSRCWYNFAAEDKVPDIIKKTGYPFIEYRVKAKDGYILTIFRIPNVGTKKPPVFMLHGVQSTAGIFVAIGKKSMAFQLYDAGYDVWLGNFRGTEYSEEHDTLNSTQKEYWDYSVDDIGLQDVPAMLQLVNYHSGHRGKTIYIGHSMGTTAAIIYASEYPETAWEHLGLIVMLTPSYKLPNMRSPIRLVLPLLNPALEVANRFNLVQSFSGGSLRNLTRPTCLSSAPAMYACMSIINLFLGPFTQIAPETLPVYFNQFPGGTSLKSINYLNEATRNRFRKYDYGPGKNQILYGNETPPEYDLSKIKVPIYIMFAARDWAISREDSMRFYNSLPQEVRYGMYEIRRMNFNHYDFLFGRDSKKLVTDKLLQVLDKYLADK